MKRAILPIFIGLFFLICFISGMLLFTKQSSTRDNKGELVTTILEKNAVISTIPMVTPTPIITSILHTPTPTVKIKLTITPTLTPSKMPTISPTIPVKAQVKLMPLGDSITYGSVAAGGYRTGLWQWLVQGDGDKIDFVGSLSSGPPELGDPNHEGHIGWTIAQLDTFAFNWMRLYKPDIVLLHIGSNDLDQSIPASVMTQNLTKLIGNIFAGKPDTYVVVSTLIPTTRGNQADWASFNASIPGVAAQFRNQGYKIVSIDMSQALSTSDLADGLHPNAIGNSKMSSMWYPTVSTIYKEYSAKL